MPTLRLENLADISTECFSLHQAKIRKFQFCTDSPPTVLLDRVRTGCLSVTWLVPSHLIPQLVKRAKVNTFFQEHRILKVTVSGEIIYEEEVSI